MALDEEVSPPNQWGLLSQSMQGNPSFGGLLGQLFDSAKAARGGLVDPTFWNWFLGRQLPGYSETETQNDPNTQGALRRRALSAEQGTINDVYRNLAPYYDAGRADMKARNARLGDV